MPDAIASSMGIVAYLALFASVGIIFLFVNLLVGSFVRPHDPHEEKLEIYECGEPTIGSSFVQFDLRFYVVALLFIIFDVEVAFFFPWAAVFGKSNNLHDPTVEVVAAQQDQLRLTTTGKQLLNEMGVRNPRVPQTVPASLREQYVQAFGAAAANGQVRTSEQAAWVLKNSARQFAWVTLFDIAAFFAVLMVGFFYVWRRGDLDWVRAVSRERQIRAPDDAAEPASEQLISA